LNVPARDARSPRNAESEFPLEAAHRRSFSNRQRLAGGGECGCSYCLRTFDASDVTAWVHRDSTARCPHCGIDAVLSSGTDPITQAFLRLMHARWFGRTIRLDLSAEWMKLQASACPARVAPGED
jgi:hypothetical protein